ncbi:unnamed protein product [Effrenium voratum]|uniref:Helicase C-terminal domain-containing protein n=1 Tax=Effrenium voratum TaxID=2562239 RepID=A0AA36HZV4_9DINO|nr:unnamed protein product [Effrenium voratum]
MCADILVGRDMPAPISGRQTLLFSATIPQKIRDMCPQILREKRTANLTIGFYDDDKGGSCESITQLLRWSPDEKQRVQELVQDLRRVWDRKKGRVVIFSNMRITADSLAHELKREGMTCRHLHGKLDQEVREKVFDGFRRGEFDILVATNVASRGLDFPDVSLVVQFNLPDSVDVYTHRVGRTGRIGQVGHALAYMGPRDKRIAAKLVVTWTGFGTWPSALRPCGTGAEYRARESIYLSALVGQEAEMTQLKAIAAEIMGAYGDASRAAQRGALSDAASNMEVLMLRQQARSKEQRVRQLKDDLEANRFDQSDPAGKALMQKCKALLSENRELGELMGQDRLADLRVALQNEQRRNAELLQKCEESAEFCRELSQDNEKLQGSIAKVAGTLRQARTELEQLKRQRQEAKAHRKQEKLRQKAAALAQTELAGAEIPAAVEVVDDEEAKLQAGVTSIASQAPKEKKKKRKVSTSEPVAAQFG